MITGEKFAWGHMPRTGGDATDIMFRILASNLLIPLQMDDTSKHEKHATFKARAIEGKDHALNIRRLPSVFLSVRAQLQFQGIYPDYKPVPPPTRDDCLNIDSTYGHWNLTRLGMPGPFATIPDRYLRAFTDDGKSPIKHWLRMESLREDFLAFARRFYEVPDEIDAKVMEVSTKEPLTYDHNPESLFKTWDYERLYANNPLWRRAELEAYGSLLS